MTVSVNPFCKSLSLKSLFTWSKTVRCLDSGLKEERRKEKTKNIRGQMRGTFQQAYLHQCAWLCRWAGHWFCWPGLWGLCAWSWWPVCPVHHICWLPHKLHMCWRFQHPPAQPTMAAATASQPIYLIPSDTPHNSDKSFTLNVPHTSNKWCTLHQLYLKLLFPLSLKAWGLIYGPVYIYICAPTFEQFMDLCNHRSIKIILALH